MSMTAGDVIDLVLERLEEDAGSPVFVKRTELLQHLNDGFLEFQLIAFQQTEETTHTLIGAKVQGMPVDAIAILNLSYGSKTIEKNSVENFDREESNWDSRHGILRKWAPAGLDQWIIDRHPTAAIDVLLTTLKVPATLGESDTIDLEQEYIDGLANYVFHMARFKEGGIEFQHSMPQYDQFLDVAGLHLEQSFADEFMLVARDPNADTGIGYSTLVTNQ